MLVILCVVLALVALATRYRMGNSRRRRSEAGADVEIYTRRVALAP